jgi:chitinase
MKLSVKLWMSLVFFIGFINCKKASEKGVEPMITMPVSSTLTTYTDSVIRIQPVITPEENYTYSWNIDGKTVSSQRNLEYKSQDIGEHHVTFTVTNASNSSYDSSFKLIVLKSTQYKVMGYLPTYKSVLPQNVRWDALSHLCYAFVGVNPDGSLNETAIDLLIETVVKEGHKNGVAVLASVGGGGTTGFSACMLNETARKKLAINLVEFAGLTEVDGLDIDFEEFDGSPTGASDLDLQKRSALESLYKDLREKLPADKLLTAAVSPSWLNPNWGYFNCYTSTMHQYLNYVGLMIYDQTGTYVASPYGQHSDFNAHFIPSINHWLNNQHLPPAKLLAGVPFYGYKFRSTNGGLADAISYADILLQYPNDSPENKDNVGLIFYNGRGTIQRKANYVSANHLGGIMIWELTHDTGDASKNLLSVIKEAFGF